jgi:hypothetical protein
MNQKNDRMQHLLLLTRFLMIEQAKGCTELKDTEVTKFIEDREDKDGIDNLSMENEVFAKDTLSTMNKFYEIFKDNPMIDEGNGVKELSSAGYVTISFYILLRYLRNNYATNNDDFNKYFSGFLIEYFYPRWSSNRDNDMDMLSFASNTQGGLEALERRDIILKDMFFDYLKENEFTIETKDIQRNFNEAQKIKIYRKYNGICQKCKEEEKPEKECIVSWKEYEADHILSHSAGGKTIVDNGQVLCRNHNRKKSNN